MKLVRAAAVAAGCVLLAPSVAEAQEGGFVLNQFRPTPAGDTFFGVPSPFVEGHLVPRAYAMFDYAHRPVRVSSEDGAEVPIVAQQGFLHINGSLALWERLQVNVDFPVLLTQTGEDPAVTGLQFTALESPKVADLRLGLRGRAFGDDGSAFQLGGGAYFYAPIGDRAQYVGDGAFRAAAHANLGGRVGDDIAFVYSASVGGEFRTSDSPHLLTFGAGAGVVFARDVFQLGAEFYGNLPVGNDNFLSVLPLQAAETGTSGEVLFSGKLRVLGGLTFGAGAGPGVFRSAGTPVVRVLGTIGWEPSGPGAAACDDQDADGICDDVDACPDKKGEANDDEAKNGCPAEDCENADRDGDGINDCIDACPDEEGEPSTDPQKDGCPQDADGDGIGDLEDACPETPGKRTDDITTNGCPGDQDGDGINDEDDACPKLAGMFDDDPEKNGCPADQDGDGIYDPQDACPTVPGEPSGAPIENGCPEDPDGDGIEYGDDACPLVYGPPSPDKTKNGCPGAVSGGPDVTGTGGPCPISTDEPSLPEKIFFRLSGSAVYDASEGVNRATVEAVQAALAQPGVNYIEVQGHTDDSGEERLNDSIAENRAKNVLNWLVSKGVSAEKLKAVGYSYKRPIADNRLRQGRSENRRVQFVIRR